jgi:protein-tyrosine-phosphatase
VSAGTELDGEVAPTVANHLTKSGNKVPVKKPKLVTADEVAAADVVISIDCDLTGLPTPRGALLEWDVPALSADFARVDEEIRRRVIELVDELVRKHQAR